MAVGNAQKLSLLQPQQKMDGVVFDLDGAAMDGYVAGVWVPAHCRVNTRGHQKGTMLVRNQDHLYRAAMGAPRYGLANGAPRHETRGRTTAEVPFATRRKAATHRLTWGDYADYYKVGTQWDSSSDEAEARGFAIEQEDDAAEICQASLVGQDEWDLMTTIAGTDLAGAGAAVPTMDVTTMLPAQFVGAGTLWDADDFPFFRFLGSVLDYLQDISDKSVFDLLVDRQTARQMATNLEVQGIRLIAGGDDASGYSISTIRQESRLSQQAVVARLLGLDRIGRVVVAGARAEFAPEGAPSDRRYLMPRMMHFCHFGSKKAKLVRTNDGMSISAKTGGMLKVIAKRQPLFRAEDPEKLWASWNAEETSGHNVTDPSCSLSIFNQ